MINRLRAILRLKSIPNMEKLRRSLTGMILLSLTHCASAPKNPWAEVPGPSHGKMEAIGSYDRGCLSGATALSENTKGLQIMRPGRNRFYGHPHLIEYLENLAHTTRTAQVDWLLVGDLANPRGGPHLQGHKSHQTGLDVDIWFMNPSLSTIYSREERNTISARSVLLTGSHPSLNPELWTSTQETVLKIAASFNQVERIFVNPVIKKELCRKFQSDSKQKYWLRKIRPWWGHDDHFHVRLGCPQTSTLCNAQGPLPTGNGCDGSLDWWFSEEAKEQERRMLEAQLEVDTQKLPVLPSECDAVLFSN